MLVMKAFVVVSEVDVEKEAVVVAVDWVKDVFVLDVVVGKVLVLLMVMILPVVLLGVESVVLRLVNLYVLAWEVVVV